MPPRYSAVDWTVDELLADVRLEAQIPDANLTDAEILGIASSSIWAEMVSLQSAEQAVSGADIDFMETNASDLEGSDGDLLWMPPSAADTILAVHWYATADSNSSFYALSPQVISSIDDYIDDGSVGSPLYYVMEGGRMRLVPRPNGTGRVRVYYQARHPELVVTASTKTANTVGASTITLSSTHPTAWPAAPYSVDLYSAYAPHHAYYRGLPISGDSGSTLTIDTTDIDATKLADIPDDGSVVVALSDQAAHVRLPLVYRRPLTLLVAARILRQMGDTNGANEHYGDFARSMASARDQAAPRVKGQSLKWINRNTPLRSRTGRWGRRNG